MNATKLKVFSKIVIDISELSKDPRQKVGALILRPDLSICSMGYNGFPKGFPDDMDVWNNKELKLKIVKHAEENALDFSRDQDMVGYSLIVTHFPCSLCAGHIVQKGIKKIYYLIEPNNKEDFSISKLIFDECKVEYFRI